MKVNCKVCKTPFNVIPSQKKNGKGVYCSTDCQYKGIHLKRTNIYKCKYCGVKFRYQKSIKRVFCSNKCRLDNQSNPEQIFNCGYCGKECWYKDYNFARTTKFCSRKCSSTHHGEMLKGSNSHLWVDGRTSELVLLRNSSKYSKWREKVFARDNYCCVKCGDRNYKKRGVSVVLNAHHIKPFASYPELRFDLDNGETLCIDCHRSTETYGRPSNT